MNAELSALNDRVLKALENLPIANPLTLVSDDSYSQSDDGPARRIISKVCEDSESELSLRIESEYLGCGPLEPLLADSEITEIILNGGDSIWFEKNGRLERWTDGFLSPVTYRNFIARVSRESGMQANLDCPFADGHWRNCRIHLIIPPASGDQAVLTMRRHPMNPWTLERFHGEGWASQANLDLLKSLIDARMNFLIVGCTGSGKTSVLNACLQNLPTSERAVIIEDTLELRIPNPASIRLLTRRDPHGHLREVDQSELLRQALRMRPDRIIMGEVRGGEAKDLLMAFATGHSGCMGTLHADSARQALLRLEMLIQLGAPQWSLHAVRMLIWLSMKAIVVVEKDGDGKRRLEGIYRIASLEDIGFLIDKVC